MNTYFHFLWIEI